ncbi:MAG: ABC transporter ATP-binding protein [Bacteroidota bacterium]
MLSVSHLHKSFEQEQVLKDLSLELGTRQMLSILGRSGSGKTTFLRIIAGLEQPDQGDIFWHEQRMNEVPPHQRNIVYLYQEALLFPHLTVFENIAFGLRLRKVPKSEADDRVRQMIQDLELHGQQDKMPHQLSGGQRQRVSFGRALIVNPLLLLLDEPFGNLDVETRKRMQDFLKRIAETYKITAIFVTHDLKEAILMGDRIGYMRKGSLYLYEDVREFVEDARTEAANEIAFWEEVARK